MQLLLLLLQLQVVVVVVVVVVSAGAAASAAVGATAAADVAGSCLIPLADLSPCLFAFPQGSHSNPTHSPCSKHIISSSMMALITSLGRIVPSQGYPKKALEALNIACSFAPGTSNHCLLLTFHCLVAAFRRPLHCRLLIFSLPLDGLSLISALPFVDLPLPLDCLS